MGRWGDTAKFLAALPVIAAIVLLLVGASQPGTTTGLIVQAESGTFVVDAASGAIETALEADVVSPDRRTGYRTAGRGSTTRLEAFSMDTGAVRWHREVPGVLEARMATNDEVVVLAEPGGSTYTPLPRARTTLVVVDRFGGEPEVHDLPGNYEPEALSTDGASVFVIAYTPPLAPERYQVRRLDLVSGEVGDVFTPDAHLQEEMGGTARTQVASADGRRLYTLYTQTSEGSATSAFIHVLDLEEQWAHCILLPDGTATGPPSGTALDLTGDGSFLYVGDRSTRTLVEVDTASLRVRRTAELDGIPAGDREGLTIAASEHAVAVAADERVAVLDRDGLAWAGTWHAGVSVVDVAADGDRFYAATASSIAVLDEGAGLLTRLTPPGLDRILRLGTGEHVEPSVVCAC